MNGEVKYLSDIKIAWYALALYALSPNPITIEQSFNIIAPEGHVKTKQAEIKISSPEIAALRENEGLQWKQIGKIFGISKHAAFKRYEKYKRNKTQAERERKAG